MSYKKLTLLLLLAVFTLSACAKNPVTKKDEFVLMSEKSEIALGKQYAPVFTKQFGGRFNDEELQEYVNKLGQSLARNSDRPELFYHFTVLDSPVVNAFALPGGYVFVTRGLLAAVNSETELAGVLGHEIGHVTARHSVAQHTKSQAYGIGKQVVSILLPEIANFTQVADVFASGIIMGYGRENEMQSDRLAVKYLTQSNYDPNGMSNFLSTLRVTEEGKAKGQTFEGFFSSHPDTKVRIDTATQLAKETGFKSDPVTDRKLQDIYFKKIDGLPFGESSSEGFFLVNRFIHPDLKIEMTFPEGWFYQNTPQQVIAQNRSGKRDEKKKDAKVEKSTLFTTFSVRELTKRSELKPYVQNLLKAANVKPEKQWKEIINGKEAYIVIYKGNNRGIKHKKNMTAFIAKGPQLYLLTSFASSSDFSKNYALFEKYYRSFKFLTSAEAKEFQPPHIHIYKVKKGDTFEKLAKTFYGDSKKAKVVSQINGMKPDEKLVPGRNIKVIRIN